MNSPATHATTKTTKTIEGISPHHTPKAHLSSTCSTSLPSEGFLRLWCWRVFCSIGAQMRHFGPSVTLPFVEGSWASGCVKFFTPVGAKMSQSTPCASLRS